MRKRAKVSKESVVQSEIQLWTALGSKILAFGFVDLCGPPWEGEDVQRQLIINYPPPEICPQAKCTDQG